MAIVPDDRDWTWVLQRPCPECGFDASPCLPSRSPRCCAPMPVFGRAYCSGRPRELRRRPSDDRWSPLEYACHVRDVCRLYRERLGLILGEDDPLYPNWEQDDTALADRYREKEPATVAAQLSMEATRLADAFAAVRGGQLKRRGRRSDVASFTVAGFAGSMIHDPVHHLHDVTGERVG